MQLENINVESQEVLITPEQLKRRLPVSEEVREAVNAYGKVLDKSSLEQISVY